MTEPKQDAKTARNMRMQLRYDDLMREGKHGHYETMFYVWQEESAESQAEVERLRDSYEEIAAKLEQATIIVAMDNAALAHEIDDALARVRAVASRAGVARTAPTDDIEIRGMSNIAQDFGGERE